MAHAEDVHTFRAAAGSARWICDPAAVATAPAVPECAAAGEVVHVPGSTVQPLMPLPGVSKPSGSAVVAAVSRCKES